MIHLIVLAFHSLYLKILSILCTICGRFVFFVNNVKYGKNCQFLGLPKVHLSRNATCRIGDNLYVRSRFSDTGEFQPSTFNIMKSGILSIGNNVGVTSSLISCYNKITIGDNVKIGGGTRIFDTNFHSVDPLDRCGPDDLKHVKTAEIIIEDNVFVGTGCIITKGLTIGKNSIVAAGSVVVKSIPSNQIWGGNPAQFIKEL